MIISFIPTKSGHRPNSSKLAFLIIIKHSFFNSAKSKGLGKALREMFAFRRINFNGI